MSLTRWSFGLLLAIGCSSGGPSGADGGTGDRPATDRGDPGPWFCGALGACNLVTGAPCAAGTGCYVGRAGDGGIGAACSEAGRGAWGESCSTANGCREGFACLGSPGACVKLCCGGDNASCRDESRGGRPGAICAGGVTGTDVRTCTEAVSCDLYATTGNRCPVERPRCDVISADGASNCFAHEAGAAPAGDGAPCCTNGRCQPGFVCVPTDPSMGTAACVAATPNRVCRRVCNTASAQCPAGQSCQLRFVAAPDTYGACAPMR